MKPLLLLLALIDGAAALEMARRPSNIAGKRQLPALCSPVVSLHSSKLLLKSGDKLCLSVCLTCVSAAEQPDSG